MSPIYDIAMKKLIVVLVLFVGLQMSAQDQTNWLTDNEIALKQSETQNKPVLAFVTNHQKSEASALLKEAFFNSNGFDKIASKVVLLKIDISNQQTNSARLGIHYTKQTSAPGLALVDKNGKTIGEPLTLIDSENITAFLSFLNEKL